MTLNILESCLFQTQQLVPKRFGLVQFRIFKKIITWLKKVYLTFNLTLVPTGVSSLHTHDEYLGYV